MSKRIITQMLFKKTKWSTKTELKSRERKFLNEQVFSKNNWLEDHTFI